MAGRSSKSVLTLTGHRTKQEIALRKAGEAALLTGEPMKERQDVRKDPEAHREFIRLRRLFRAIGKDDALYQNVINDYCLLYGEIQSASALIQRIQDDLERLEDYKDDMEARVYRRLRKALEGCEAKEKALIDRKRDRMRAIEDKNLMTAQAALRAIPEKQERKNPLKEVLQS